MKAAFRLMLGAMFASALAACSTHGVQVGGPNLLIPASTARSATETAGIAQTAGTLSSTTQAASVASASSESLEIPSPMANVKGYNYKAVCDTMHPGDDNVCYALVRTDVGGAPDALHPDTSPDAAPPGYGPAQLRKAYELPSTTTGFGGIVAVVESGDYPTAAADLAVYRKEFGLPPCTVASGCFTKIGQTGTGKLPAENASWAEETALDIDMVSATCPYCYIVVVEANSSSNANFNIAENTAARLGATEISNSFGGSETASTNPAYDHKGIVILASAGDHGYAAGVSQPCSFTTVVCTGGTSLRPASNARGYTEVVWNDLSTGHGASGSGCSAYVAKPAWQTDSGCATRSESDVSFSADPEYGVAIYDSTPYEGYKGWLEFGGTSVSAPALAGVYALAENAKSLGPNAAKRFWTDGGTGLWPVTSGNNLSPGESCTSASYICTAGTGADGNYSGPGGWGTPKGVTDF